MRHPLASIVLRPLASLALAVALAAPLTVDAEAHAQLGRQLPSPVSAAQLESILREAGLPDSTKDAALPLHEAYFARFREFEKRDVDPLVANPSVAPFALSRSVDDARKDADARRRVFQRAAQLDNQLADELESVLPASDAWRAQKVRMALTRRRCAMLSPGIGFGGKPLEYTLRAAPILTKVDPDTRTIVNTALDAYEAELTRQLERYAEASIARIVKGAEAMQELGVGEAPGGEVGVATDGSDATAMDEWLEKMREAQRVASEETSRLVSRIRKLHREGLDQVMPMLRPDEARAMRDHLAGALYPGLRMKGEFDGLYETARTMRDNGDLPRSAWQDVQALAESNELATRPIVLALMDLAEKRIGSSDLGVLMLDSEDRDDESRAKSDRLRADFQSADAANAATLRALLGMPAAEVQTARGGRAGINMADIANVQGNVQIEGAAIMIGGGGEMIALSSDDFADGGFVFGGMGMSGMGGAARPMTRAELDALAGKLGFTGDTRGVFDEIAARCAEARNAAEKEHKPQAPQFVGGDEDGGLTVTIGVAIGGDGEGSIDFGDLAASSAALAEAIERAEEAMFDELKAVAADDRAEAVEAARRARARVRLLPGETGVAAVDLVATAEAAALPDAAKARISAPLRTWDEASVATIRSMQSEVRTLEAEQQKIFESATVTEDTTEESADGSTSVGVARAMRIDDEMSKRLEEIGRRVGDARERVSKFNRGTFDAMMSALEGDADAQKALRRAFYRSSSPSTYASARDLEPFFTKAGAIEGLSDSAKSSLAALRGEWIESRESRCEEFVRGQEASRSAAGGPAADPAAGMAQMQTRMRERKKLREDLEQIEATTFRRLQELLVTEVGADKAKEIGELPTRRRPAGATIQFGR
jgi:hypothetical protein